MIPAPLFPERSARAPQGEAAGEEAKETLCIEGIQTEPALARFAGNRARYEHWLVEFIAHGPDAAAQIRQAVLHGSHEAAIGLAHALKGRTGMLGMAELQYIAMSLEMALRNREPTALWLEELEKTTAEMSHNIARVMHTPH